MNVLNEIGIDTDKYSIGEVMIANAKQGLFFKAKDGIIEAIEIQAEGSKRMNARDYLRGHEL